MPQTIADALAYLQHHLQEVTKRQNHSETNINNILSTLIAQLQQLMQLVSSPHSPAPVTAPSLIPVPLTSLPVALRSQAHPKLLFPLDFYRE